MSVADYREIEPMYDQLRTEIPHLGNISLSQVQRVYRFGYNRAARIMEHLADEGVLHWDQTTGKYSLLNQEGHQK